MQLSPIANVRGQMDMGMVLEQSSDVGPVEA